MGLSLKMKLGHELRLNLRVGRERGLKLGIGRGLEEVGPKLMIHLSLDMGVEIEGGR